MIIFSYMNSFHCDNYHELRRYMQGFVTGVWQIKLFSEDT